MRYKPLAALAAVLTVLACRENVPPRHLVKLQAFRCREPHQALCLDSAKGAPIPRDSLPPADEAFQVWAWHPGKGRVVYRVEWKSRFFVGDTTSPLAAKDNENEFQQAGDSSMLSYNFSNAVRSRFVLKVQLKTPRGKIQDEDSLVWDYSRIPPADMPGMEHHHQ